jgi:hypothetical protein
MRREWILAGLCAFVFSCGGGGGGSSPSDGIPVSLYFAGSESMYSEILVKVYEVRLCHDMSWCFDHPCRNTVSLFTNQQGLQADLTKLNYITTTNIPEGTYPELEVVVDKNLTIKDQNGSHQAIFEPMQEGLCKFLLCATDGKCYIKSLSLLTLTDLRKFGLANANAVELDVHFTQFEVNTSTNPWQVTNVKTLTLTLYK